ncbi:hypothetical protein [Sphingobacterium multivorum]|uniref:hypothetical protein n=1 Tax=Sphingobacterium multivorum TaxID=28454 RepID=UPI0028AF69D1|nr:hypothetical protein [Sphingobacterium multivorum]
MKQIAVIGQGYVGFHHAIEFAQHFPILGFEIDQERVEELNFEKNRTLEAYLGNLTLGLKQFAETNFSVGFKVSSSLKELAEVQIYIVTVKKTIYPYTAPDLRPLLKASEMLDNFLKHRDIIEYESTVYPNSIDEDCFPILEKYWG